MFATATIIGDAAPTTSGTTAAVPWWSFTKTVLAAAALRLVDRGTLDLDTPPADHRFTLRQLLRHQAGVPDYGALDRYQTDVAAGNAPWPVQDLLAAVGANRPMFEPGTGWSYSNVGYLLVTRMIEAGTGCRLPDALRALVFDPLHLTTAKVAISPDDLHGVEMGSASGYHPGWVYHGLVVGTVTDAARMLHALIGGMLLRPATLTAMLDGLALPEHRSDAHPDPAYGLGIMLSASDPMLHPIGHSGEGPGSRIAVYSNAGRTAAVWTALPAADDAETIARRLLARPSV